MAQNGLPTAANGQWPAALMAVVGLAAGRMVVLPSTVTGSCMPTVRITAATGIGITKKIVAESHYLTTKAAPGVHPAKTGDAAPNARRGAADRDEHRQAAGVIEPPSDVGSAVISKRAMIWERVLP
jgi:hypothetical protein